MSVWKIELPSEIIEITEQYIRNNMPGGTTEILIPEGVASIGDRAFGDCTRLKSIVIPGSVQSIGRWAFTTCIRLQSVVIPEGVESIGVLAFNHCKSLESIVIPEGVETIGNAAFHGCSQLQKIILPDSFFDGQTGEVTAGEKERLGISENTQCIKYSNHIINSIKEINGVIGEKRFKENHKENDKDKISRLLLSKRIRDGLDPRGLSKDEEKTLKTKNTASDVYKVVQSINDFERKSQWAEFLEVKIDKTDDHEPHVTQEEKEKIKAIREQMCEIELENKLKAKISQCGMGVNSFITLQEISRLTMASKEGLETKTRSSHRTEKYDKLRESLVTCQQELGSWIERHNTGTEDKNGDTLDDIVKKVNTLYDQECPSNSSGASHRRNR